MASKKLELEWYPDDAVWLRSMLSSPSGERFLDAMHKLKPALNGETIDSTAMSARKGEGYDLAMRNHIVLTTMDTGNQNDSTEIAWMDIRNGKE